jgi:hypothetical protein
MLAKLHYVRDRNKYQRDDSLRSVDNERAHAALVEHDVPAFEEASLARPSFDGRKDGFLVTLMHGVEIRCQDIAVAIAWFVSFW